MHTEYEVFTSYLVLLDSGQGFKQTIFFLTAYQKTMKINVNEFIFEHKTKKF